MFCYPPLSIFGHDLDFLFKWMNVKCCVCVEVSYFLSPVILIFLLPTCAKFYVFPDATDDEDIDDPVNTAMPPPAPSARPVRKRSLSLKAAAAAADSGQQPKRVTPQDRLKEFLSMCNQGVYL